jgi:predicted nucleotidyltransferase
MNEDKLTEILYELRIGLLDILADRMDAVYLYGSQARSEAWAGSDIDVLIVLKGVFNYGEMLDRSIDLVAALSLDYNVVISRTFVSKERFENEMSPFLMNVRREAVPA